MKLLDLSILALSLSTLVYGCATLNIGKWSPDYKGVDPEAAPYVNEWLSLAKDRGLKFDRVVTVGFKDIDNDHIVGQCNYGMGFREIDIDKTYWSIYTNIERQTLLYHELSHCYCDRMHDYAEGKFYKDPDDKDGKNDPAGFFEDECPISIMYPTIVSNMCMVIHYGQYVKEMFDRCNEY